MLAFIRSFTHYTRATRQVYTSQDETIQFQSPVSNLQRDLIIN